MRLCNDNYILVAPEKLIPTEEINEHRALKLEQAIKACGRWIITVCVHENSLFVMDGHHRLSIAKKIKLKRMPVVLLDYTQVDVCAWRTGEIITPHQIIEMAKSGNHSHYCQILRG